MSASYARAAAPTIARHAIAADVVHVWGGDFPCAAAVHAAISAKKPVVVTPFAHRGQWGDDAASARAYRRADAAVGLLQTDCELLRDLGVAADRVVECPVCSPGVERGGGAAWRQAHGVLGPLVAFLGVRREYKGVGILIDAIPGPREPACRRHRRVRRTWRSGAADTCAARDRPRPGLGGRACGILDAADVLCLPSAGEIFPVSILEAWSAKTAVLTSDIPPLAELMRRSGGGVAVPRTVDAVADGLASMLTDGTTAFGEAGHLYWTRHATVTSVVSRHEAIYRSVMSGEPAASLDERMAIV